MFIGARVAVLSGNLLQAGVVISVAGDSYYVMLDNETSVKAKADKLQLINNWKTYKTPKEVGSFKVFPSTTTAEQIFMSKKPILFGVGGMRSVWTWGNEKVFDGKMTEPKFIATTSRSQYGSYTYGAGKSELRISTRNHSMIEFTSTIVHEQIHQYNMQIEHSPYGAEGSHGKSFRRWIPIVREKTGIKITITGETNDDVADFSDVKPEANDEPTTKEFIFLLFKSGSHWFCINVDQRYNLPLLYGQVQSYLSAQYDAPIYAGKSNINRVKMETLNSKDGNLPNKLKLAFSPSLVNLLAATAKPINGYMLPDTIELKG